MKRITHYFSLTITLLCALLVAFSALGATKQRVISLSPANTELAYAAGLGDSLIVVSAYSDYPEQAKKLEQVSDWQGLNVERIIALKPDLILAWRGGNPSGLLINSQASVSQLFISILKLLMMSSTQ